MIHNFIFLGDGGGQVCLKGDIQVSSNKICNCNAICYSALGQCCLKQFFNVSLLFNYQNVEAHTHTHVWLAEVTPWIHSFDKEAVSW